MITSAQAREILQHCHISLGDDCDTLSSSIVDQLLEQADLHKYRKPKNANGSRARYFRAYLQRRAARKD